MTEHAEVIVVGGGQTGLVAGYYLAQAEIPFLILDALPRVGDSWRRRWDSLRLFSSAQYCSLPGLRFPGHREHFPSKEEMADYLETYARTFELPIRLDTTITSLESSTRGYRLDTGSRVFEADHVIVATGAYRNPYVPPVAEKVGDEVFQVHTHNYRNPEQVPGRNVLVVGAANSGAQIAEDLAGTHRVTLSQGSKLPHFPRRFLGKSLHWYGDKFGLIAKPLETERDRLHKKTILVGPSLRKLSRRHGIDLVGRTIDASGRTVRFQDGGEVETDAIVWATGFRYDFSWIQLPLFDGNGVPRQLRGVTEAPGLYFLGLQCQYSYGSGLIWWVKDDAAYVVEQIRSGRRHDRAINASAQR